MRAELRFPLKPLYAAERISRTSSSTCRKLRRRRKAHGSIGVQEAQPNPGLRQIGRIRRLPVGDNGGRFCQQVKRLTEGGNDLAVLGLAGVEPMRRIECTVLTGTLAPLLG